MNAVNTDGRNSNRQQSVYPVLVEAGRIQRRHAAEYPGPATSLVSVLGLVRWTSRAMSTNPYRPHLTRSGRGWDSQPMNLDHHSSTSSPVQATSPTTVLQRSQPSPVQSTLLLYR